MNLTRREVVDDQLNAIAINMIHLAVTPKDRAHIRSLKTAKEAWDELDKLFLGNGSIQSSRFNEVNNMANDFVMIEGESPEEMYRRLIALAVQMQDLGATFVDDPWIKRKFYNALLPYEEVKLMAICQNASFRSMTSNEVLREVIALDISKKNAEDRVARVHNTRKLNLALKMKEHGASESNEDPIEWGPDDLKAKYHEHMALAVKSFLSGNKRRSSRPSCYNCGDIRHFVADCIYERRDANGGYLIRKSKFRSLSKGLTKLSSNNDDTKISFTEKPRTNMLGNQDHMVEKERFEKKEELEIISLTQAYEEEVCMRMTLEASALILEDFNNSLISQLIKDRDYALGWVDELKAKKCYLEENHEWSLEEVATFTKKKEDEGPNPCCDKLLDEVCFLRRHNAKFLEVISTQEEALDEYYRLSKEKVQCCDHEEEIATLKKHKAKLFEVNERQNESLLEWIRLSKENVTCCNHKDEIAYLKRSKDKLMVIKLMQDEALKEYQLSSKGHTCCNHKDGVNHLNSKIESLQVQIKFLEGVIEARVETYEDSFNEGEVAIMPKKIERGRRINEKKNVMIGPIEKWVPISKS
ncbi:hypothetical protein QYE76_035216 [Lolium multiflorum]|uniref:CCHC-type domain-containing protein n=1 Tax=Lolium multiflorum TaxID=4521 RepID=A0AAD8QYT3_LOLMU|nr:hypothetical protein QYE76_035216 [Lolium multiflorum]